MEAVEERFEKLLNDLGFNMEVKTFHYPNDGREMYEVRIFKRGMRFLHIYYEGLDLLDAYRGLADKLYRRMTIPGSGLSFLDLEDMLPLLEGYRLWEYDGYSVEDYEKHCKSRGLRRGIWLFDLGQEK